MAPNRVPRSKSAATSRAIEAAAAIAPVASRAVAARLAKMAARTASSKEEHTAFGSGEIGNANVATRSVVTREKTQLDDDVRASDWLRDCEFESDRRVAANHWEKQQLI